MQSRHMQERWLPLKALVACALYASSVPAMAWTEPGHMVIAEITYDILKRDAPDLLDDIVKAIEHHPDKASFRVAVNGTVGEEKSRRLFAECSRWPMDAAGSVYDHPTWHVGGRDLSREKGYVVNESKKFGNAMEAFRLNLATWQDDTATDSEKALSLCWVMHIVGDMHDPVHAAQEVSSALPNGDRWGTRQFVRESAGSVAVSLHRYWDYGISKDADRERTRRKSGEIAASFSEEALSPPGKLDANEAFLSWVGETYELAVSTTYGPDLVTSLSAENAPVLPNSYQRHAKQAIAKQAALAGSRLAWVLSRRP